MSCSRRKWLIAMCSYSQSSPHLELLCRSRHLSRAEPVHYSLTPGIDEERRRKTHAERSVQAMNILKYDESHSVVKHKQKGQRSRLSLASGGAYRVLSIVRRSPFPSLSILELERVEAFLVVLCCGIYLIDSCWGGHFCSRRKVRAGSLEGTVCFRALCLFCQSLPFVFSRLFSCFGAILVLCVFLRAIVE